MQKHKSKKEVMEEIISKSKFYKVLIPFCTIETTANSCLEFLTCNFNFLLFYFFFLISYQAQKAKDREENEHLVEELDKNFTSLVQSEALLSLTRPDKVNALKALVNKSIPNEYMKKDDVSAMQHIKSFKQVYYSSWSWDCFHLLDLMLLN